MSLVALAALLTTSLCLGPLYQRAMEQALAGSVLAGAAEPQKALRLTADDRGATELAAEVPRGLDRYLTPAIASQAVQVSVTPPGGAVVVTRLYAVNDACDRLRVVEGSCPDASGEVMVSADDVTVNGWTVGSEVKVAEEVDPLETAAPGERTARIVGVYERGGTENDKPVAFEKYGDALVSWNSDKVIDVIEGTCNPFERPEGKPRQPANDQPRGSCAA